VSRPFTPASVDTRTAEKIAKTLWFALFSQLRALSESPKLPVKKSEGQLLKLRELFNELDGIAWKGKSMQIEIERCRRRAKDIGVMFKDLGMEEKGTGVDNADGFEVID
jgi:hypothetical protein